MSILRISNCKHCNRRSVLTERSGGWTVDCYYSHPLNCVVDNESWCDEYEDYESSFFETPNEAIEKWNENNK